jgi:integrase
MTAKKLPSGRWRVQVYLGKDGNGKNIVKSVTEDTKKKAEFEAAKLKMQSEKYHSDNCTIADALDRYITNREKTLSPSTYREYRLSQKRDYKSIENLSLSAVNSEKVQIFVNETAASHSPKSTRNIYGLLRASLKAIAPDLTITVHLPQKKISKHTVPVDEELKTLVDRADQELKKAILLAATGTLRRGEISGLEYSDIKENFIHVQRVVIRDVNNQWITKDIPKTASSDRWVEFPAGVIELLGEGDGRIVPLNPDRITDRFCKLRNKLGINCRFHDLRHYAASIMHALGVPDEYIMQRGGWSSDVTLKAVYRDVLEDKKSEFVDRTNDYMQKFLD